MGATLVDVAGKVTVNDKACAKGSALEEGDVVTVGKEGLARIEFADGTRVLVAYDDEREQSGSVRIGAPRVSGGFKTMVIRLTDGLCTFFVKSSGRRRKRFEIRATASITGVFGTEGKMPPKFCLPTKSQY